MPTSAPANRAFNSPAASWIPPVAASEASTRPCRMAIHRSGVSSSEGELR